MHNDFPEDRGVRYGRGHVTGNFRVVDCGVRLTKILLNLMGPGVFGGLIYP